MAVRIRRMRVRRTTIDAEPAEHADLSCKEKIL